jgi:GMP synthase (glutamine-hydrolysing)
MNIHIIIHEKFEGPGAINNWISARGHQVSYTKVYLNQKLPIDSKGLDLVMVLGGPQDPATTVAQSRYFDAAAEIGFIRAAIDRGKAVFGVCLGAQLIGEALGAAFESSEQTEIGSFPIQLSAAGKLDNKLKHFPEQVDVGHWHNDMPGLTPECQVLASSAGCPRQIVQYTQRVYGFQCHLELTSDSIEQLIVHSQEQLEQHKTAKFVQQPEQLRRIVTDEMNQLLFVFLDQLLDAYQAESHPVKPSQGMQHGN